MTRPSLQQPPRWLWLVLAIPALIGLARLRFDTDVLDLLPSELRVVQGLKIYQQHFSNARELVLTLQSETAERTEEAARRIAEKLRSLTNRVANVTWQAPWIEHPDQTAELLAYIWFNQPPSVFDQLTNRLSPARVAETLEDTREQLATSMSPEELGRLSYDPFGLTRLPEAAAGSAPSFATAGEAFSSPDGTFRILFVEARNELHGYQECEDFLTLVQATVSAALAGMPPGEKIKVNYTGRPAFVTEVASGMRQDIVYSVAGTVAIIAILFWIAHRRVKPMLWLVALLALTLASTLGLGGLIFGRINVLSIGFAAILLGLAVDYAVVHYQDALAEPHLTIPQIRHAIAPSIFWAAITTIAAFLVLNFGGLPGLGQLGTLVGLGVALSALIMIFEYLPPLFPERNKPTADLAAKPVAESVNPAHSGRPRLVYAATVALLAFAAVVFAVLGLPRIDGTANALRPRHSPSYLAMDEIQQHLSRRGELRWLIIGGDNAEQIAQRLTEVQHVLERAQSNGVVASFTLPTPLWPHAGYQAENRALAGQLAAEKNLLREAALTNGFTETSLGLMQGMLATWQRAAATPGAFQPTNDLSRWVFNKAMALTPTNQFALGLIYPTTNRTAHAQQSATLAELLPKDHVWLTDWELLGQAIFTRVQENLWKVIAPMVVLVLISLWLAFHRAREIFLSLAVLLLSGVCLLVVMRLAGWSWNLLNLMAIPLILGTGVDYGIFMQLALRRHHGDLLAAHRAVGRALLLCGGTAVAAFLMLGLSSNAGMASLGQVCAVGIASNMLIATFLLPVWWRNVVRPSHTGHGEKHQQFH